MNRPVRTTVAIVSGLFFIPGCSLNPLTSDKSDNTGEISITSESVGEVAYQSIDETGAPPELLSITSPAPSNLLEQTAIPEFKVDTKQSLGKKNAASSFALDTIDDTLRIALTTVGILQNKYDTIDVLLDATAFDDIEGNETLLKLFGSTVYTNGTVESYRIEDRDGDGIINGSDTPPNRAALQFTTTYTNDILGHKKGEVTTACLEADAGADNDFGTEGDNNLYSASWIKTMRDDTIACAYVEDADGDSRISSTGAGTSRVRFFEKDNPLKPFVDYGKAVITVERDEQGTERTVSFYAEEKLVTGRLNRVRVTNDAGDILLTKGEMAQVQFATNSPSVADSEITAQAVYLIDPGDNLGDVSDNVLHEITLAKSYRFGRLDTVTFHSALAPPVPNGENPTAGTFELTATFRNGKDASLVGTFEERVIKGTYTGPEGNESEVVLRRD